MVPYLMSIAYMVLGLLLLLIAKAVQNLITPYRIDDELTTNDNVALSASVGGYLLGCIIIIIGACLGDYLEEPDSIGAFLAILGVDAAYALGGIAVLNIGRWILDRAVVPRFSTGKEIIGDRNLGMGAVECGAYIATALVIAGAISGPVGGVVSALVFFVLGQIALVVLALVFQFSTRFDLHAELERDNVAAGISFAGSLVAFGVLLYAASHGDISALVVAADGGFPWRLALTDFAIMGLVGLIALWIIRLVIDKALLPGSAMSHEIAVDRNAGAAWIEAVVTIGLAVLIVAML